MGPCPHHRITPLALGLQIITHLQAQLMRTNNFQCHLTYFLSKERKNSSWAGPRGLETYWAKLTVFKPLACFTTCLRLSVETAPLCFLEELGCRGAWDAKDRAQVPLLSLGKNSLRQASSSDTWLISHPQESSFFFSSRLLRGTCHPHVHPLPRPHSPGSRWAEGGEVRAVVLSILAFKTVPGAGCEATPGHKPHLFQEGANPHRIQRTARAGSRVVEWATLRAPSSDRAPPASQSCFCPCMYYFIMQNKCHLSTLL